MTGPAARARVGHVLQPARSLVEGEDGDDLRLEPFGEPPQHDLVYFLQVVLAFEHVADLLQHLADVHVVSMNLDPLLPQEVLRVGEGGLRDEVVDQLAPRLGREEVLLVAVDVEDGVHLVPEDAGRDGHDVGRARTSQVAQAERVGLALHRRLHRLDEAGVVLQVADGEGLFGLGDDARVRFVVAHALLEDA
jgi:hypothetical protein